MSTAKKEDTDFKMCAKALLDMASKLKEATAKSAGDSTLATDLEISQLTTVDQWLLAAVEDLLKRQKDTLVEGFARVSNVAVEIEASLAKLPGFTDEVGFREAGVKLVQKLASAAAKLENNLSSLRDSMESVDILSSVRFSDKGPDEALCKSCDVKSKTDELEAADKKATMAGCVVALVASVCLLRGPELAESSPDVSVFAQLRDVQKTLQVKVSKLSDDKKQANPDGSDMVAFAEKILEECGTVLAQQGDPKKRKAPVPGEDPALAGDKEPSKKTAQTQNKEKEKCAAKAKAKQKAQKVAEEKQDDPKPKQDNKKGKDKEKADKAPEKQPAKIKRPAPVAEEEPKKRQTSLLDGMSKKGRK